jgi:selenocysteine-specific elongation factor
MRHLIIGTAGHVDHGKTALIKAMTGKDCDTHKEEKERGITINLGFAHLDLPSGNSLGIVDVPGHKDFIKTMVAGAYGIDLVLLVVAADSGIMPQTREHVHIIEILGIRHGVVALTKSDLVDEETAELAQLEIEEFLEGSSIDGAPVVRVSSLTGDCIRELITTIESVIPQIKEKAIDARFRMYIDRIFNIKGLGYVVTGSVLEGTAETGNDLFLLPGSLKKVKIRNIERHGASVNQVYCGDRAALNLAGLKQEDYIRGMVLSNKILEETNLIDASFSMFTEAQALPVWSNVIFYSGTFECTARMHIIDKDQCAGGESVIVQIHLIKPAILLKKDRFIIRNSSNNQTLGGGIVIDDHPLHHRKRTDKLISELAELKEATLHSDKLINLIKIELGKINMPVYADALYAILHKPVEEIVDECKKNEGVNVRILTSDGQIILLRNEKDKFYYDSVINEIKLWHLNNPILEEGPGTIDFYGKFGLSNHDAGKKYLEMLMNRIKTDGLIKEISGGWALSDHKVVIDKKTETQLAWLEMTIKNAGMEKPFASDIEDQAHQQKINKDRLKMMLKYLAGKGRLIFFDGEYIHRDIVDNCRLKLLEKIAVKDDGINEKEFRELIGGTRKLVQLLIGIFSAEQTIIKKTFYLMITSKGKEWLENNKKS